MDSRQIQKIEREAISDRGMLLGVARLVKSLSGWSQTLSGWSVVGLSSVVGLRNPRDMGICYALLLIPVIQKQRNP